MMIIGRSSCQVWAYLKGIKGILQQLTMTNVSQDHMNSAKLPIDFWQHP